MHDLHVIQGPNVTRDAREKIAFFAFHAFVVEDSRFQQNRVRTRLYNGGACVCKSNVEIRIAGSFCHPQQLFSLMSAKVVDIYIIIKYIQVKTYTFSEISV